MERLVNIYINRMVNYLAKEGKRMAQDALNRKDPKNRSENQADSFGYAVFFNGEVKKKGYARETPLAEKAHKGWKSAGIADGYGREWLNEFFTEWKPKEKGFVLIVVNAAFYSLIQEQGGGTLTRKYQVITQIVSDMQDLQSKFKGSTLRGHNITIG